MLPALKITVLGEEERECTLRELVAGKVGVIDLWHTKCTKCPAALCKFNDDAEKFGNEEVLFIACALSLGEGNKEEVTDLACEEWESLTHIFLDEETKAAAKAAFGYTQVPFYVVFGRDGSILKMGDHKSVDYLALLSAARNETAPTSAPTYPDSDSVTTATAPAATAPAPTGVDENACPVSEAASAADSKTPPAAPAHVFTMDEDF